MIVQKEKASGATLAIGNIKHKESYHKSHRESKKNLKELIGCILLHLVSGQAEPSGWRIFDLLLRQVYAEAQ